MDWQFSCSVHTGGFISANNSRSIPSIPHPCTTRIRFCTKSWCRWFAYTHITSHPLTRRKYFGSAATTESNNGLHQCFWKSACCLCLRRAAQMQRLMQPSMSLSSVQNLKSNKTTCILKKKTLCCQQHTFLCIQKGSELQIMFFLKSRTTQSAIQPHSKKDKQING